MPSGVGVRHPHPAKSTDSERHTMFRTFRTLSSILALTLTATACTDLATSPSAPAPAIAAKAVTTASGTGGGGGGGGVKVDDIRVSKCFTNASATSGGEMLIKASSSDPTARLFAYRPDGTLQGEVQNGGGSRYGGTVMAYIPYDPGSMIIRSSSGGSITVPTTPFQI